MANALEAVTGGVPKAPAPPDIEDVLGPPPHAPRLGGRGHALATANRYRRGGPPRPPSPPHVRRTVAGQSAQQKASQPQKIVIEQKAPAPVAPTRKKTLQEEYAPVEPEVNPHAGRPIHRAVRNAGKIADMINPLRRQQDQPSTQTPPAPAAAAADDGDDDETPSTEPRPEQVQRHHDETRRQVDEAMRALREDRP